MQTALQLWLQAHPASLMPAPGMLLEPSVMLEPGNPRSAFRCQIWAGVCTQGFSLSPPPTETEGKYAFLDFKILKLKLSGADDPPLKAGAQQLSVCPKGGRHASSPRTSHALNEVGKDKSGPFHLPFGHGIWAGKWPNYPAQVGQRCIQHPQPSPMGGPEGSE